MSKNKTYTADDVLAMCKEYMNETHIKILLKKLSILRHMLIKNKFVNLEKLILCIPFK